MNFLSKTATIHRICLWKKLKITVYDEITTVTLKITSAQDLEMKINFCGLGVKINVCVGFWGEN